MEQIDERDILEVIRAVEAGTVTVTKSDPWDYHRNDHPVFTTSSGWRFTVFNDVDEWDYIESITSPDGRVTRRFESTSQLMPTLDAYWPSSIEALRRWGFDEDEATRCQARTREERGLR